MVLIKLLSPSFWIHVSFYRHLDLLATPHSAMYHLTGYYSKRVFTDRFVHRAKRILFWFRTRWPQRDSDFVVSMDYTKVSLVREPRWEPLQTQWHELHVVR